jgi:glycosyltransferase involved in cell wall biosynthesis
MRILHAARNIANQPGDVVRALRRLGHEAELWEYGPNPFGYPTDRRIDLKQGDPRIFWQTFLESIDRFDVIHFHFARTFFPNAWGGVPAFWDLPIYRMLDKKVFFTFHGSDIRVRRIHEQVNPWSYYRYSDIASDDDRTEKVIEAIRTYANRMFVQSIDYRHFVPEAEVVERVIDLTAWPEQPPAQRADPIVLHVPSRRGTKGTEFVIAGMKQLAGEGLKVDFRLLEGVSHDEARRAIQAADVVVDNLLTGDYEVVSIETMASSRVAVANIQADVAAAYPDAPVVSADPDTFVERMRALLSNVDERLDLAARGRPYVARIHDAPVIAEKLLTFYRADYPPVRPGTLPDWFSLDGKRQIERLESRIAGLEQEIARERRAQNRLRSKLDLAPLPIAERGDPRQRSEVAKSALPDPIRLALRRTRARITRRIRSR